LGDFFTNSSGHPDTERVFVKAKHGKNQFVGLALVHVFRGKGVIFGNDSSRIETGSKTNGCRSRRPDEFAKISRPKCGPTHFLAKLLHNLDRGKN
jgi:hypothetical protein